MKKIILSIVLSTILLASCSTTNNVKWNASLIEMYNKTVDDIEDFEELISLETIGDTLIHKQINAVGNKLLTHVSESIIKLSKKQTDEDAEQCRIAAVEALESIKGQTTFGLRFVQFSKSTLEADVENFASDYDEYSAHTASKVDDFRKKHEDFERKIEEKQKN